MNIKEIIKTALNQNETMFKYRYDNSIYNVKIKTKNDDIKLSYIIAYNDEIEDDYTLVLESVNNETENEEELLESALMTCGKLGKILKEENAPIIIPVLPSGEKYYQQLARDTTEINEDILKIIEDAKKEIEKEKAKTTNEKIFINGYSSSGVFAQRFALLNPEIIKLALIGGASGTIPMVDEELNYPLGIKDYKEIMNKDFNEQAYKNIKFRYYVAEYETLKKANTRYDEKGDNAPMHDMSYYERSTPKEEGQKLRNKYGIDLIERSKNEINILKIKGYNIEQKIINNRCHNDYTYKGVNEISDQILKEEYQEEIKNRKTR